MKGLTNANEGNDFSSMSTKEIIDCMAESLVTIAGAVEKQFIFMLTEKAYREMRIHRYRKCKIKKGPGRFRYVAIGQANIKFKEAK